MQQPKQFSRTAWAGFTTLVTLAVLIGVVPAAVWAQVPANGGNARPTLLAQVFQDHAVLQRDKPITVWGMAAAGEGVTVSLAAASAQAQADAAGHWSARLPAMEAGGPFVLSAQTEHGARQSAADVLVGDVYLCSGQSNMELPVSRTGDARNEIASSANNTIRMLTVVHDAKPAPLQEFANPTPWQIAGAETVADWSAACFYFGRELQKSVQVPIGLLHSSWGGSNIRPWISATGYKTVGGYDAVLDLVALYAKDPPAAQQKFAGQWEAWWRNQTGDRPGAEPWSVGKGRGGRSGLSGVDSSGAARGSGSAGASTGRDRSRASGGGDNGGASHRPGSTGAPTDSEWRSAPAGLGDWRTWGTGELKEFAGLIWFRTHVNLTAAQAKAAVGIDLGPINQVDETWLNGKALGNTFGYGTERSYSIAPGWLHAGDNLLVVNALSDYGGGGLLAGGRKRALRLGDGGIIPLDGPWEYRVAPTAVGYPPRAPWESVGGVTTLYNAMIAPLGSYGIRGVVWYQGESNASRAASYEGLLSGLMADWRGQFGAELPFLIVQLPNYGAEPVKPGQQSSWAALRDAQRAAVAHDRHAGLAVTIDIGEPRNLHPTNKQDVGKRLARAARHVIYGEGITPSGPVAVRAVAGGGRVAGSSRAAGGGRVAGARYVAGDGQLTSGGQVAGGSHSSRDDHGADAAAVTVEFADVDGGLVAYSNDRPIGFELCGDTPSSCRFAEARIEGTRVVLTAPGEGRPATEVRYCWAESPVCTLFDKAGLPAGPFKLTVQAGGGR